MNRHNIFAATTVAFRGVKPFIEKELRAWLAAMKIKPLYREPGSPWQNGYIESFHARFREECLNREQLWTLTEARVVIEDWRWLYNHVRPHRSLGNVTLRRFAEDINTKGSGSIRTTPSLHPNLDFLYQLNFNIKSLQTNSLGGPVYVTRSQKTFSSESFGRI